MCAPVLPNTPSVTDDSSSHSKLVELGAAIMDKVSGSHFTFLLPGVGSRREIVSHAQRLIGLFQKKGIYHARVVVSVSQYPAATFIPLTPDRSRRARREYQLHRY